MSSLYVDLKVGISGKFAEACIPAALAAAEGMYDIVDAVAGVVRVAGYDIQSLLQFHSGIVSARFAMAGVGRKVQRCTVRYLALHHHEEQRLCGGIDTCGIVQVGMCIDAQRLGSGLRLAVGFVELHAVFPGIVG